MSRTKVFLSILRGSLLMRRGRVALAVLAIAIGTSVAAALLLVSRDVGAKVEKELRAYGPNAMLVSASGGLATPESPPVFTRTPAVELLGCKQPSAVCFGEG